MKMIRKIKRNKVKKQESCIPYSPENLYFRHKFMFKFFCFCFGLNITKRNCRMQMECYQNAWKTMHAYLQGCPCDVWMSWGICMHSLDFLVFCIGSILEIAKTVEVNGTCLIQLVYDVFSLALLFWGEFSSLIQICQIIEIAKLSSLRGKS